MVCNKGKRLCWSACGIVWRERDNFFHDMGMHCLRERKQWMPKGMQRGERGLLSYEVPSRILGVGVTERLSVGNAPVFYFWLSRRARLAFWSSTMKYGGRQGNRHISWYFRAPLELLMERHKPRLHERSWNTSNTFHIPGRSLEIYAWKYKVHQVLIIAPVSGDSLSERWYLLEVVFEIQLRVLFPNNHTQRISMNTLQNWIGHNILRLNLTAIVHKICDYWVSHD